MSDNSMQQQENESLHDSSLKQENQNETVDEILDDVLQNSDHIEMQKVKKEIPEVNKSRQENTGNLRVRDYFCELCKQSFTRSQSLIRHNERKHAEL